jgi:chaperonin cofactor prefoldin
MNEDLFKKELDKIKEQKQQMSAMLQLMEQVNHEHIPDDRRVFRLKDDAMDNIVE